MSINRLLQSKERGTAMALALIALVLLLVMGMGLLSLGQHSRIFAIKATTGIAARCAADAGLIKAIYEMNNKLEEKPWDDNTLPEAINVLLPNSNTFFSYEINGDSSTGYVIEATGTSGIATETVNSVLQLKGLFDYAIFTEDTLLLRQGTTVAGYNFDPDDDNLMIGTNSTSADSLLLGPGVTIEGDVVVGAEGDAAVVVDAINQTTITGDTYPLEEEFELPSITVPSYLESLPSQGTLTNSITIVAPMKYDGISLNSGRILTIDGPVVLYVTGDVLFDTSAEVRIVDVNTNPNAFLVMYLTGDLTSQNEGIINNMTKDPRKLKIFALDSCKHIDFKTENVFYGAIYAPEAEVHLYNYVRFYGSVVAKSFIQDVYCDFNYDAALRDASVNDEGTYFTIKRWWEH